MAQLLMVNAQSTRPGNAAGLLNRRCAITRRAGLCYQMQQPLRRRLARVARSAQVSAAAAAPAPSSGSPDGGNAVTSLATTLNKGFPLVVLGATGWAVVQRAVLFVPGQLAAALGVAALSAGAMLMLESSMRSMTSHARALARFAVRYCGTATVGIFASEWLGLPLLLTAWLALAGGLVGSLVASQLPPAAAAAQPAAAAAQPEQPGGPAAPAAAAARAEEPAEAPGEPAPLAGRLPAAPPSVQTFITRWGTRGGIDSATGGAPVVPPATVVSAAAASAAPVGEEDELAAKLARLQLAPTSVQAFIARWGHREGIEGAHGQALVQPAVAAAAGAAATPDDPAAQAARLALAPPSVQDFIARWGQRAGIEAAAAAEGLQGLLAEEAAPAAGPAAAEASGDELAAKLARLSLAPASIQAFIARWGRREGIEGAHGQALVQPAAEAGANAQAAAAAGMVFSDDPAAQAARLALAPASVQAFVARWGRREGIEGAYTTPTPTVVPASEQEPAAPAQQAQQGSGESVEELAAKAARMALAPAAVQAFIARWGRRGGIEAAHDDTSNGNGHGAGYHANGAGPAADSAAAAAEAAARLALAPPAVQDFIKRWGQREGLNGAALH